MKRFTISKSFVLSLLPYEICPASQAHSKQCTGLYKCILRFKHFLIDIIYELIDFSSNSSKAKVNEDASGDISAV